MAKNKRKRLSDFEFSEMSVLELVKVNAVDDYSTSLAVVASTICRLPEFSCTINAADLNIFIEKWVAKYLGGMRNRASQRTSRPISTKADSILDDIIKARIENLTADDIEKIKYGHRLSMSAENIAGSLLEEFLAERLIEFGWHCCWGGTMKSIDFCNKDGGLLQIKNSDNSENSSSRAIREGTDIKHWYRRKFKSGTTNWDVLNELMGINDEAKKLSETELSFPSKSIII